MSNRRAQTLPPQMMEDKPQRGKCLTGLCFMWKILTCLVSHATLVLLVVCYCVGGAYLFQHLEKPHEIEVKKGIQNIRYNLTEKIWKFSDNTSVLSESDWIENVEKDLKSFENQILTAMKNNGWDGDEDINKTQWTFAGSLFYSIIVITTIGYGHISPHTDWGKVTTIFYAIMGIPLMLLCLSNIGDVMATSFRFIYWRVCCYMCTRKSRPRRRSRPQPQRVEYPQRQRSHLASLRRSNRRSGHNVGANAALPHAHSDPELRHINQRDFDASRSELHDIYYDDDMHRDGCRWDCPCHAHENLEGRRHSRARWDYEDPAAPARHSTRSERWSRAVPNVTEEQYIRYTQSLPRGRAASRRMRAKTVEPHMNGGSQRANYVHSHQQTTARADDADKMPIITNRYAVQNFKKESSHAPSHSQLRSQSMPRALHMQQRDSLTAHVQNDADIPRTKRSRAMSVMPRNPPYSPAMYCAHPHNSHHAKCIELSELKSSYQSRYKLSPAAAAAPSPECMQCCSDYYAASSRDNYAPLDDSHLHYQSSFRHHPNHYHQHQNNQHCPMSHQGIHRDSRKAIIRQSRTEKLPPSPRIMSPMGFAVKRQTRRISSFEYDDDSPYGGPADYYGDMAEKNRPVPIWLCVFLVISYILGGAVLFTYWEQWSFLDSAYFCFITLTTIGFGDFVPAKGVKDESEQSIAYCSLYLLFGIALLAMSFNLVQEEFIANVKEVARRLGIIKEDEDDED